VDNADFERSLLGRAVGDAVSVTVRRGDKTESLQQALAPLQTGRSRLPNDYVARASSEPTEADRFWRVLGVRLAPVPQDRARMIPSRYKGGLLVTEVRSDSAAAKNGIRKDDILVGLWGFETLKFEDVSWILGHPEQANAPEEKDRYYVIRGQQTLYGRMQLLVADSNPNTVIK
jgi:serine protease Do